MSTNTNVPEVSSQGDFQSEATALHMAAFFNPYRKTREEALAQIRYNSRHNSETWKQLDANAGIQTANSDDSDSGSEEITADSPMPYQAGIDHSENVLDEQIVDATILDSLLGMGFAVPSSLSNYAYTTQLQAGRMEADISMNPRSRSRQDRARNGLDGVPLPVVHVDYELDAREVEVAQAHGDDPGTRHARTARQAINRREARLLWDGWGGRFDIEQLGAFTVGGLNQDNPDKVLQVASGGGWQDPDVVMGDMNALHDAVEQQGEEENSDVIDAADVPLVEQVGAMLFVPRKRWGQVTRTDYESAATDEPLITRINRKYPHLNIMPAPRLDGETAIMLLNDPRYFQIINAQSMTNTAWDVDGGHGSRNKLVSSRIPFVRIQPDRIKGIVRMTGV